MLLDFLKRPHQFSTYTLTSNMSPRPSNAWVFKTVVAEDRSYISNDGYDDVLSSKYVYDSNVANSKQVKSGDIVVLINKKVILGYAKIAKIESYEATKEIRRCPIDGCGNTTFEARKTLTPKYRCNKGHEFSEPQKDTVPITKYEAHYGETFQQEKQHNSIQLLKGSYKNGYNRNMSIQAIDVSFFEQSNTYSFDGTLLNQYFDLVKDNELPEANSMEEYRFKEGDYRNKVNRQISERRGQQKFRKVQMDRFEGKCCVTGCSIVHLLEAAHINPYRGESDNHPQNGLLLRTDIHTLFDLDMLAIEPGSLIIKLKSEVNKEDYRALEGSKLYLPNGLKLSKEALRARWELFQKRDNT